MASFFNNTNKQIPDSAINWSLLAGAESTKPSSSSDSSSSSTTTPKISSDHATDSPDQSSPPPSSPSLSSSMNKTSKSISKAEPWMPKMVGLSQDPNDWLWQMTEEPHRSRRRAILKDHPEVRKLMGSPGPRNGSSYSSSLSNSRSLLISVCVQSNTPNRPGAGTIHEITHNLAFKKILHNKLLALFSNLPIGVPYAMVFKRYHLEHHKSLGEDGIDTDLPTRLELLCLKNVLGKLFSRNTFQILFYALRPGFVRSQKVTGWVLASFALQLGFDFLLYKYFGLAAVMYLIMSSFFAGSLHPCAAHFIAEHYVWNEDGGEQETWSYYGPLNILAYNTPRFPIDPWTRLPELKAMASEYYDPLPQHYSWPLVIVKFIFDNRVGLFSRVKRLPLGPHLPIVPYENLSKQEDRKNI
ncbi:hypothetical protein KEM48_012523 [Puccinia striiformis f. sp. tritici PST-130]|nr:hypothetical protein KEM48_012523 [Puccinia striiformis f. sp. tritici PST-130]